MISYSCDVLLEVGFVTRIYGQLHYRDSFELAYDCEFRFGKAFVSLTRLGDVKIVYNLHVLLFSFVLFYLTMEHEINSSTNASISRLIYCNYEDPN